MMRILLIVLAVAVLGAIPAGCATINAWHNVDR